MKRMKYKWSSEEWQVVQDKEVMLLKTHYRNGETQALVLEDGKEREVPWTFLTEVPIPYLEKTLNGRTEKNDCAVTALAAALQVEYWQAHKFFHEHGRRIGRGTYTLQTIGCKPRTLFGCRLGQVRLRPRMTVARLLKRKGTFLVCVAHHCFAIHDGKVLTYVRSVNQPIQHYWPVTRQKDLITTKIDTMPRKKKATPAKEEPGVMTVVTTEVERKPGDTVWFKTRAGETLQGEYLKDYLHKKSGATWLVLKVDGKQKYITQKQVRDEPDVDE